MKVIITGGGSGGHVSTGEALYREINSKYKDTVALIYVGGKAVSESVEELMSLEEKRFSGTDINLVTIRCGKLQRFVSRSSLRMLLGTWGGFVDSYKLLKKFKPDIIISTGGYVTLPVTILGKIFGSKVYLHEQTAHLGLTNRIVSRFADAVFITFNETKKYISKRSKVKLVGLPIRKELLSLNTESELYKKINEYKLNSRKPVIYISGGGLGSHTINLNFRALLPKILELGLFIIQVGENPVHKDYELLEKERMKLPPSLQNSLIVKKYFNAEEVSVLLNSADLFVGRSGANTVYELGLFGLRSVLIPIPFVTGNEQFRNAKILESKGLATILPEGELTPQTLKTNIMYNLAAKRKIFIDRDVFPTTAVEKMINYIFEEE